MFVLLKARRAGVIAPIVLAASVLFAGCSGGGGGNGGPGVPLGAVFSNPTAVTNPHAPWGTLTEAVLEGTVDGQPFRSVLKRLAGTKDFTVNGKTVQALIIEDRAFQGGALVEVALDYYAQSDDGAVYYLGEDVDIYENGMIVSHAGAWLLGRDTTVAGLFMPANPRVGDKFKVEDVPARSGQPAIREDAEVIAVGETVTVPAGTYTNCVRLRLVLEDGTVETKLFAPGVGIIREADAGSLKELKSRT